MRCRIVISVLLYMFGVQQQSNAQEALDTICIVGNPSHLSVPHTEGSHYTWDVKGGDVLSRKDSNDIQVLWGPSPGFFKISVTETNKFGCVSDPVSAVVFLSLPDQALIEGPDKVCRGSEIVLNGAAGHDFVWKGGRKRGSLSFTAEKDTTIYLVALNGKCRNDTFYHRIQVTDPPVASMNPLEDTVNINSELDFFYTGTTAENVNWYINDRFHGSGYYQNYQLTHEGEYKISQVVESGECTDTIKKVVFVTDDFAVFIPNAFTPNDDGVNDIFLFRGRGIKSYSGQIYNRWGSLLFSWEDDSESQGWNGYYKGELAKQDTYLYKINVEDYRGVLHKYSGSVNLIR